MNNLIKQNKTKKSTKSTKPAKNNKSKIKKWGTPYTFPSILKFWKDYSCKNWERLKPMPHSNRAKIIFEEYKKEKDRIRRNYVYTNFTNERDKEQLIENLKNAEEFTEPKKNMMVFYLELIQSNN